MTVSQLSLYNGALRECKARKLLNLSEPREARFLLDDVWGDGGVTSGAVRYCLEDGLWGFATRTASVDYDPDYVPDFGMLYRFPQPTDFVRTVSLCVDDHFNEPLTQYSEETGAWYSDLQTIFVKYVSNDPTAGLDFTQWPESFVLFVERYMAFRIVGKLTKSQAAEDALEKKMMMAAKVARSKAAMEQPAKFPPQGMLVKARLGYWSQGNYRRGS